jgi:FkbM family methyltransferase
MNSASLQDRLYDALAGRATTRNAALWVRNVSTQVLAHRLAPTIDPDYNGEALLQRELAPGLHTVIDVGANRGEWTVDLLEAASAVERVLCYEPGSSALKVLRGRLDSDSRVEIVAAAVSDVAGELDFFDEPDAGETSSLIRSHSNTAASRRRVEVVTLDEEIEKRGIDRVDLLKIDAEGMDLHVLRGASRTLAGHRIAVAQFEYNAPWAAVGSTLAAAFQLLRGHGYEVLALLPDGLHRHDPERTGELFVYSNFVALSPERMAMLREKVLPPAI